MTETLFRSLEIGESTGRTLSGIAIPWDKASRVRDPGGPPYLEAFAAQSADVTMRMHATFPVFVRHDYAADPIGVVSFQRSSEGLMFEVPLSKTTRADEMLELVNDGAMRSVSVGFRPVKAAKRRTLDGEVTVRTEIALRELSLAPTGFGQVPEAKVLAVRTEVEGTPILDALQRRKNRLVIPQHVR